MNNTVVKPISMNLTETLIQFPQSISKLCGLPDRRMGIHTDRPRGILPVDKGYPGNPKNVSELNWHMYQVCETSITSGIGKKTERVPKRRYRDISQSKRWYGGLRTTLASNLINSIKFFLISTSRKNLDYKEIKMNRCNECHEIYVEADCPNCAYAKTIGYKGGRCDECEARLSYMNRCEAHKKTSVGGRCVESEARLS